MTSYGTSSSTAIRECQDRSSQNSDNVAVIYAFCNFQDTDTLRTTHILGSLAKQLFLLSPGTDMHHTLQSIYQKNTDSKTGETRSPSEGDLVTVIEQLCCEFDHVYAVIDGLDECPVQTRESSLIPSFLSLSESTTNLSLLLTSRRELDIEKAFASKSQLVAPQLSIAEDIQFHIKSQLVQQPRLMQIKDEEKQLILEQLSAKADGM
jgi:hypothetical protein